MSRIILSIPTDLLKDLDSYCVILRYNRSEAIRKAIRDMVHMKSVLNQVDPESDPES